MKNTEQVPTSKRRLWLAKSVKIYFAAAKQLGYTREDFLEGIADWLFEEDNEKFETLIQLLEEASGKSVPIQ